jgi:hypothetical protein
VLLFNIWHSKRSCNIYMSVSALLRYF